MKTLLAFAAGLLAIALAPPAHADMNIGVQQPAQPPAPLKVGRPSVQVTPPLVPPAGPTPSIGGAPSTVILPPENPPVPPQLILRGFGDLPGQLPLPPGHVGTMPENLFPHQRN